MIRQFGLVVEHLKDLTGPVRSGSDYARSIIDSQSINQCVEHRRPASLKKSMLHVIGSKDSDTISYFTRIMRLPAVSSTMMIFSSALSFCVPYTGDVFLS